MRDVRLLAWWRAPCPFCGRRYLVTSFHLAFACSDPTGANMSAMDPPRPSEDMRDWGPEYPDYDG